MSKGDIEKQFAATQRQLQGVLYTTNVLQDEVERSQLAFEEVKTLGEKDIVYKSTGRVFVQVPQPTCHKNLVNNIEFCSTEVEKNILLRKELLTKLTTLESDYKKL
jgi:chaperonin cofactor prefoldin